MSRYESKYPVKMEKGDCIGIAAPSSPFDPDEFERGLSVLRGMGFEVYVPESIHDRRGFLAGSDEQRAETLNELFDDPRVKAVMCARGGYGAMRILDLIDGEILRRSRKICVGFSDATALLNYVYQSLGLVCFHGPVVCSLGISDKETQDDLEHLLLTGRTHGMPAQEGQVLVPGKAEGVLMGGNLATLCHLTGTDYQPDFRDAIVMLEDVGESPYKIDRMLTQMNLAGVFDQVNAVVLGSFERCGEPDQLADVFYHAFEAHGIPVAMGFPFGHGSQNRLFPIGGKGWLDTDTLEVGY